MLSYKRIVLAMALAGALLVPALFEKMWMVSTGMSIGITVANLPGIFLAAAGGFFPPEGYPGQSPVRCLLIMLVQGTIWYLLFSIIHGRRQRKRGGTEG